jgi:hypothetical protein
LGDISAMTIWRIFRSSGYEKKSRNEGSIAVATDFKNFEKNHD